MATTTTYDVMKRKAGSDRDFYLHMIDDAPLACFNDEFAQFDTLDEAYACAAKLEPEYETRIRVTETTVHAYYL